ncbi:MAG: hypothetical protein KDK36_06180, partial [Leptospiraceae bacterium]|nr:hypothetical protein [Leptospiraceae bacterium]
LNAIREYEKKANRLYEEGKYKESAELNLKIKDSILNSSREENVKILTPILLTIDYNIATAYFEYFKNRLRELDNSKPEKENILTKCKEIFKEYNKFEHYLKNPENKKYIEDKIVYSVISILVKDEKKGDEEFQKMEWNNSQNTYTGVLQYLQLYSFHPEILKVKSRILSKLDNVNKSGNLLLYSRVKSYSDISENNILKANLAKNIDKDEAKSKEILEEAESAILGAEKEIQSMQGFLSDDVRNLFNKSVLKLKKERESFTMKPILSGQEIEQRIYERKKNISKKMEYILPGSGRIYLNRYEGYIITGLFLANLYFVNFYNDLNKNYKKLEKESDRNQKFFQALYYYSPPSPSFNRITFYKDPIYPALGGYYGNQKERYGDSDGSTNSQRNMSIVSALCIYLWNLADFYDVKNKYLSISSGFHFDFGMKNVSFERLGNARVFEMGFSYLY